MPELPEVESLRRYLVREGLVGSTITSVKLETKPESPGGTGTIIGANHANGQTITNITRRGKQLALELNDFALGVHMGMTGQLHFLLPEEPEPRFTRALFTLNSGTRLALIDPRRWAKLQRFDSSAEAFDGLGPDALDDRLTADDFAGRFDKRTGQIKQLLLNQRLIAGIGNIYADESFHRVKISPARRANTISESKLKSLHTAVRESLEHALEFILNHPDEFGRPYIVDAYDDRMQLHRKLGSFCPRCEIPLVTKKFGGRTAYFCTSCQK